MKAVFASLCCLAVSTFAAAQSIHYNFAAPNAAHHEAEISITANGLPAGPAYFRMSRSSPGRYATHEFGKNVYNVKAADAAGAVLPVEKAEGDVYRVSTHKGTVKLTYTLFANYADGTYASVDPAGFHLNMPATFMWVKGMEKAPISIKFLLPDTSWKMATQLKPGSSSHTFTAPGLQYFMDCPTKAGKLQFADWEVAQANNKTYRFRLALEADASAAEATAFAGKLQRIVGEARAIFGELPAYDYGMYTFIAGINPYVKGDGMEHRNSTMITIPRRFDGSDNLLNVFSHEFFHCWNVERIRPKGLEPFDFEKSNMTDGLWVAEGFTQYYGNLILARAGFLSKDAFLQSMAGLINVKNNTPGAQNYTPVENSQRAVFVDAGVAVAKTNYANMYASYYSYGGAIALALDLDLRARFANRSLDDFMRELWKRFGKTEKPYDMPDLQVALAAITNAGYAANFFKKYVHGHEPFDYATAVEKAGLSLVAESNAPWAGDVNFAPDGKTLKMVSGPIKGSPLYNAGTDADDELVSLDDKTINTKKEWDDAIGMHKPGEAVALRYKHRGQLVETQLTLQTGKRVKLAPAAATTNAQRSFMLGWTGSKEMKEVEIDR